MENDDTKKKQPQTPKELPPSGVNIQADSKSHPSDNRKKKPQKNKKWSLIQHWRFATRKQQLRWVAELIGGLIALGYLFNYVWGNLQTKWNADMQHKQFSIEHRPRLDFFREPALVGEFTCNVDDTSIRWKTGEMYIWVKNTKTGDAPNAFVGGPQLQLVPDPKIGIKELDTVAPVTDETCGLEVTPKMKMFPLNGGQERMLDMRQSAGARSLVPTKSLSVTFGQPEPPTNATPKSGSKITNETTFQLYGPTCVYYFDEEGHRHGTCVTYRFFRADGNTDFPCKQTPISGKFEQMLWGYCEN